ncbi:MAG: hypothetical protein WC330_05395 [Candidatus Omnitrophota bacterium]
MLRHITTKKVSEGKYYPLWATLERSVLINPPGFYIANPRTVVLPMGI